MSEPKEPIVRVTVPFPQPLHEVLVREAKANHRSLNQEIVAMCEALLLSTHKMQSDKQP